MDYALLTIRDHGGSISRKQLTAILCSKFELAYSTASAFIKEQINKNLYEVNGEVHASPDSALAF